MFPPYMEKPSDTYTLLRYPAEAYLARHEGAHLQVHPHWHAYSEALYVTEGVYEIHIEKNRCRLEKGDFLYISPLRTHAILTRSEGASAVVCLKFDPGVLKSSVENPVESRLLSIFSAGADEPGFFRIAAGNTALPGIIRRLLEEMEEKAYGFEYAVRDGICDIALLCARILHKQSQTDEREKLVDLNAYQQLGGVFRYVAENFDQDIQLSSVLALCNFSYSSFAVKFKAVCGKSFREYVNMVRVTHAHNLLMTTGKSITEVALACGFNNCCYFNRVFKHTYGLSPGQLRKRLLAESAVAPDTGGEGVAASIEGSAPISPERRV